MSAFAELVTIVARLRGEGGRVVFHHRTSWYAGRNWRRWTSYAIGGPVFMLVLFVFFENFSRLLPPGV